MSQNVLLKAVFHIKVVKCTLHIIASEFSVYRKAATHDNEIQHLYEEMEQQIKKEKDRIVLQVKRH